VDELNNTKEIKALRNEIKPANLVKTGKKVNKNRYLGQK